MKIIYTLILTAIVSGAAAIPEAGESSSWVNNRIWELAFNTGDTRALADLYSDDAVVIPPSLEILDAPEKIEGFWQAQISGGTNNFRVQTINTRQQGDVIYQTAIWIATRVSNGVATELDGEMTNVISLQKDGSWKIQLQSWN